MVTEGTHTVFSSVCRWRVVTKSESGSQATVLVARTREAPGTPITINLKRQSDLRASFAHFTQNFTGNSMVAIIFVKNVQLRNGSHFKIEPPKSRGAICDQTVSLIKKWKKIDPHYFLILEGVCFLDQFD